MRNVFAVDRVNIPRTVLGIEWRLAVAVSMFFGMAALLFAAPAILIAPILIGAFLRGPGVRDPEFLNIIKRHSVQEDFYSPAYLSAVNYVTPRPTGFSRAIAQ